MPTPAPRFFSLNTDTPLTYDVCGQLISKDGFLHHRRCFEWNVFILVTEGQLHITANGIEYTVSPNQYIFLKAGEEHFGHQASQGKLSYLWVHLSGDKPFEAVVSSAPEQMLPYYFPEQGEITSSKRVFRLFLQLMALSMEEQVHPSLMLDYTLSLLLLEVTAEQKRTQTLPARKLPPVILSICEWIRENYYRSFSVAELADLFGYQADYLSSLFKKHMSISLTEYTNRLRIEASKTHLANYDLSIKEAAYSCGFPDEKYFMKVFKKFEGMTPTEYKGTL